MSTFIFIKTHALLGVKTYFLLNKLKKVKKKSLAYLGSDDNENKIMSFVVGDFFLYIQFVGKISQTSKISGHHSVDILCFCLPLRHTSVDQQVLSVQKFFTPSP